jgi:glutamate dehydrogenase
MAHLTVPGQDAYSTGSDADASDAGLHRVSNAPGYSTPVFAGKAEQRADVLARVADKGFIPHELVAPEVDWFYGALGIDDTYFAASGAEAIADHILALYGAKILAYTKRDPAQLVIDLEHVDESGGLFIHTSAPGVTATSGPGATCEARYVVHLLLIRVDLVANMISRIDELFLDNSSPTLAYRLETYRSAGSVSAASAQQLRCYFVSKCQFPAEPARTLADGSIDIRSVADAAFLEKATANTLQIYQRVLAHVLARYGPVIEVFEVEGARERRLVIGYRSGAPRSLFSALSHLYHFYGLYSARKYVEHFACGVTVVSLYLLPLPDAKVPIEASIFQIMKEASLLFCLPDNPFFGMDEHGQHVHAVQEASYACAHPRPAPRPRAC